MNIQKISYWPIFNPAYYAYLFYMSSYKSHTHFLCFSKGKKHCLFFIFIFLIGNTLCKVEQPLQRLKSQEREQEKEENCTGEIIAKNQRMKCAG